VWYHLVNMTLAAWRMVLAIARRDDVRYHLVKITVAAAMAAGMLLSLKLWLTERHYPHVPVWDGLPIIPPPWDRVVFGGLLLLLGLTAVLPRARWPLLAFVTVAGLWSLWDQSRWQPWFYQYLFMLAALGVAASDDPEHREAGLNACRFILAATYIWSGLQKVNFHFATDTYPWLMEPILKRLPEGLRGWAAAQGWKAAFLECGLGIGLLIWPLRLVAVALLVLMHATILFCLSPWWGHDWNSVVWPWNIAMMALNLMLFVNTPKVMPWHIIWPRRFLLARVTLVLFGIMPLFNFFGYWDSYLSAALYSGNTLDARVYLNSDDIIEKLPPEVRAKHLSGNELDLFGWAIDEMNVPPYPARRVYRGIALALSHSSSDVTLEIDERPDWQTGKRERTPERLDHR